MNSPAWATLIVSALGIGAALAVLLVSLRPDPRAAEAEIARGLERVDVAVITGGMRRGIDSDLVDLVERGVVTAADGRLAVAGRGADGHIGEAWLLSAVHEAGAGGLEAVRGRAQSFGYYTALLRLIRRGVVVSPERVQYGPTLVWGPTLATLFLCALPVISGEYGAGSVLPAWATAAIAIGALPVVPVVQILIWCRRPGYHGEDPRSRLGIDITDVLRKRIGPATSQADRVALGGLAAMTDETLRRSIAGSAAESSWRGRAWRRSAFRSNAETRASPTIG